MLRGVLSRLPVRPVVARTPWLVAASLVALLAIGVPATAAGEPETGPAPGAVLAELVQDVGGRGASRQPERYAYLEQIDSHLQDIAAGRLGSGSAAGAAAAAERQGLSLSAGGEVAVDVYVEGDLARVAADLRALGMRVTGISERAPQRMVEGYLAPAAIPAAAALPSTRALLAPFPRLSTGAALSEGDAAVHGPQARAGGATGAGVLVGVISDSIDQVGGGISDSQATGDLPANTQIVGSDLPGGTDEGRAMAEIVYDHAPGIAGIAFTSAAGGPATKANSIDALVRAGVRVIADDTSYITEPFFQDDVIAQAVDRAKAAGVAYVISAGNDGSQSWEGTYTGGSSQDFNPGAGVDTLQTVVTLPAGRSTTIVLQWAEPWGGAVSDFALDVYRLSGAGAPALAGTVNTNNLATRIPMEATSVSAPSGASRTYGIAIRRLAGTGSPFMKYVAYTNGLPTSIEYPTNSGTVDPDAASARGAITVAASRYSTPTTPETFSSRGPVTRRFDANGAPLAAPEVRQKPNVAGPDAVATSMAYPFNRFSGTSAAAPAVAGIAALVLSARPTMGVDVLYAILTNPANALDCPAAGNPDNDCGSGFLLADRAVGMALDATPPLIAPAIAPAAADGANGWYRGPVSVTWSVTDAESPVIGPVGCAAASPGDGVTALACSATSGGGATSVPVTIKRDSTPPSAPSFTGIRAGSYTPAGLPRIAALGCSATDAVSGVASCTLSGYRTGVGRHTLTAVAVDNAGLSSRSTLVYTVARPRAISLLELPDGLTLARIGRTGLALTVRVATAGTRVSAVLVARVPDARGAGLRTIALGRLEQKVPTGKARLRIALTPAGVRRLAGFERATLRVTVTGRSATARTVLLQRAKLVRRAG